MTFSTARSFASLTTAIMSDRRENDRLPLHTRPYADLVNMTRDWWTAYFTWIVLLPSLHSRYCTLCVSVCVISLLFLSSLTTFPSLFYTFTNSQFFPSIIHRNIQFFPAVQMRIQEDGGISKPQFRSIPLLLLLLLPPFAHLSDFTIVSFNWNVEGEFRIFLRTWDVEWLIWLWNIFGS